MTRAQVAGLCFLGTLALLLAGTDGLLRDPDTYWHVATGTAILREGRLPWVDPFSHTFAGQPWIAKEWLSQLVLAAAYAVDGWRGVAVLTAMALAAFVALLCWLLQSWLRPAAAFVLTVLVVPLMVPAMLARPQVFFFLLLAGWTGGLVQAVERGRSPSRGLLTLLAFWANMHASFPLALLLAAMFAGESVIHARAADRLRCALRWLAFGIAALAVCLLTPYGLEPLRIAASMAQGNEAAPFLAEWMPLPFDAPNAGILLVSGAAVVALATPRNWPRLAPVLLSGWMMFTHQRFGPVYAAVAPLALAPLLSRRFPVLAPQAGITLPRRVTYAAVAGLSLACLLQLPFMRPAPAPRISPAAALQEARAAGAVGPVYNEYDFGGFLIFSGVPTFIDGRNDQIFLGGFTQEVLEAASDSDDARFQAMLARHGVTWALVREGSRTAEKFDRAPGWRLIHRDGVASAYLRSDSDGPSLPPSR